MDDFLKIHLKNSNSYEELTRSLEFFQIDDEATTTALNAIADRVHGFYERIHTSYEDPIFAAAPPRELAAVPAAPAVSGPPRAPRFPALPAAPPIPLLGMGPPGPAGAAAPVAPAAPPADAADAADSAANAADSASIAAIASVIDADSQVAEAEIDQRPPEPPEPVTMEVYQWTKWKDWVEDVSGIDTDRPYLEVGSRAYLPCVALIEEWLLNPIGAFPMSVDILSYKVETILEPFDTPPPPP